MHPHKGVERRNRPRARAGRDMRREAGAESSRRGPPPVVPAPTPRCVCGLMCRCPGGRCDWWPHFLKGVDVGRGIPGGSCGATGAGVTTTGAKMCPSPAAPSALCPAAAAAAADAEARARLAPKAPRQTKMRLAPSSRDYTRCSINSSAEEALVTKEPNLALSTASRPHKCSASPDVSKPTPSTAQRPGAAIAATAAGPPTSNGAIAAGAGAGLGATHPPMPMA